MTKIFNFALKIKGVVGRVAHAKSSDPATPPLPKKNWNVHLDMKCWISLLKLINSYSSAVSFAFKAIDRRDTIFLMSFSP